MKKRVWTLSPIFIVFSIVVFGMAVYTYFYNPIVSVIEMICAIVASVIVIVCSVKFNRYISKTIFSSINNISDVNQTYLERFKMPVAVVGKFGDVLWVNTKFKKYVDAQSDPINTNINNYIRNSSIEDLADSDGFDIKVNNRNYIVYCTTAGDGYICYFFDNTDHKRLIKKYVETKKSVALVVFDNLDEFTKDNEELTGRISLEIETKLYRYAIDNKALFKNISKNKYMIIFDQLQLDKEIERKFSILQEIRKIKYNNREATISIGIGSGCETLIESEQQARKALDMALGRGGDQVAILKDGSYQFFGGVSAGVNSQNKVRTRVVAKSISKEIQESDKVFVMGHRYSDLDCIGAAMGLQPVIENAFKKSSKIVVNKDTTMAKKLINLADQNSFITPDEALKQITPRSLLIIVDTHIQSFVESPELLQKANRIIVIDHHRKMVNYIDNALIFYHEPVASSASEMVAELLTYMGDSYVTPLQAKALLAGIMLDTKGFVLRTGVRTFEAAAFLKTKGADTVETKTLFSNNIDIYKSKYKIIDSSEIINDCAIAVCQDNIDNIRLVSAQAADELLSVSNVKASFVISKIGDNEINISARSYGKLNVQLIMEALGGGGHQNMAATQLKDVSISSAKAQLLNTISEFNK